MGGADAANGEGSSFVSAFGDGLGSNFIKGAGDAPGAGDALHDTGWPRGETPAEDGFVDKGGEANGL